MPVSKILFGGAALLAIGMLAQWMAPIAPAVAQSQSPTPRAGADTAPTGPAGAAPPGSNMTTRPTVDGYLGEQGLPDHRVFLPPPPAAGSARANADIAIFRETRALANGPRWQLAVKDDRITQDALLEDFGCAAGLNLTAAQAPALKRLLARASADLYYLLDAPKNLYQRPRPFLTEQGPLCVTPSENLARQGSYPSRHAGTGWLYAMLLGEADPARADALIARGRAFGESRVVCGVHYQSDVDAGRLGAAALTAALHGDAEFEADVDAARGEIAALRAATEGKPEPAACKTEAVLLASP
jgi:acid phosphatase (class A)